MGRLGRSLFPPVVVALTIIATATGAPLASDRSVRSLLEIRQDRVVMQEWDLSCGAAALATLLRYQHGLDVSEHQVALALIAQKRYVANPAFVRLRHGFSLLDLKRYVERAGLRGIGYGGLQFGDVIERAPIMVPISSNGYNHFVIVRGQMGDRVLLADPNFGNRTMTVARFQRLWLDYGDMGHVGFVVAAEVSPSPPGALAPSSGDFVMLR